MILIIECIISCFLFGGFIVGSVLKNQTLWLQEYPEAVQKRYIELHPESKIKEVEGMSLKLVITKVIVSGIFLVLLSCLIYFAGAHTFVQGVKYCYTIWFVVNIFDTFVIDIGILAHWKKCRLLGTEDMDEEYKKLYKKSIVDGIAGCFIGIPVAIMAGYIVALI